MDLEIRIRQASASDAPRVAKLLNTFRDEHGHAQQASIPLPVDHQGPQYVLVALIKDVAVGVASLQRCHHLVRGATFLLLTDIYVLEEYRRHGVATTLLNEAMALGRREDCQNFSMIVRDDDEPTLATAARAGFQRHQDLLLDLMLR